MLYTLKYLRLFLEEKTDGQICYSKKLLTSKHKRREVINKKGRKYSSVVCCGWPPSARGKLDESGWKILFRMKCCERKIQFRMKKETEQVGFKNTRTGHRSTYQLNTCTPQLFMRFGFGLAGGSCSVVYRSRLNISTRVFLDVFHFHKSYFSKFVYNKHITIYLL